MSGAAIEARAAAARGPEGAVFEGVCVRVEPGALAIIAGPGGSGRTALLLALAGRFRLTSGEVTIDGLPASAGRRRVTVARARPGIDLEPRLTVAEAIAERRLLGGIEAADVDESLSRLGVRVERGDRVGALHPTQRTLLALALALAERPGGVVIDDVDEGLDDAGATEVWRALRTLASGGVTVVASCTAPPADGADVLVTLPHPTARRHAPEAAAPARAEAANGTRSAPPPAEAAGVRRDGRGGGS